MLKIPRLLSDRVLVRETPPGELKIGSILLPHMNDDARGFSKHQENALCVGTVMAVGPGEAVCIYRCKQCGTDAKIMLGEGRHLNVGTCPKCDADDFDRVGEFLVPMTVQPGDEVIFPHRAGVPTPLPGQDAKDRYFIAHEEQFIYGIVE